MMFRRSVGSALFAAFMLSAWQGQAQEAVTPAASSFDALLDSELGTPGGLTSHEVAKRALATSFDVSARQAELAAAAADVDRALYAYLPQLTVTARYMRLSPIDTPNVGTILAAPTAPPGVVPPGTPLVNVPLTFEILQNQYTLQANLLIPVSDYFLRVSQQHSAAKHAERSAKESKLVSERQVATDARVAYYTWVRARLGVIVAEQAYKLSQAHLVDAKNAEAAGAASPADVLRFESQLARSELLVTSSKNLSILTLQQLRTAMHDEADTPYRIGEDIRVPPPAIQERNLRELWAEALQNRPEIKSLEAATKARREQASAEHAGYFPRLDLVAGAAYSNPNPRVFPQEDKFTGTWEAGAQLTWQLHDIPAARARYKASEARAMALDRERRALIDRIQVEVLGAQQAVAEAEVAERTSSRGLKAAEESYRVRRLLFQNGKATSVELLDAETELTRARLDALNAHIDARVARARLEYALGKG